MTQARNDLPASASIAKSALGRNDPLLQELWAAKATLNAAADYQVCRLAAQAAEFDLDAALARLASQASH